MRTPEITPLQQRTPPTWDRLWQTAPTTLISGSGQDVGLPEGQMGNSEVGHMSLGSGRVIYQSISKIDKAIADGSFHRNPAYCQAIESAVSQGKAVHIMGLLSSGGVHSHERHIVGDTAPSRCQRCRQNLFAWVSRRAGYGRRAVP